MMNLNNIEDDLDLLHRSMDNAYRILTHKTSIRKILDSGNCWLPFTNPINPTNKDIDGVIDYFCDLEEYEMCAELVKAKEDRSIGRINFMNFKLAVPKD